MAAWFSTRHVPCSNPPPWVSVAQSVKRRGRDMGTTFCQTSHAEPDDACRDGKACPQAVADLVTQCVDRNPAARPMISEIVALLGRPEDQLPPTLLPREASRPPAGAPVCSFLLCLS